MRQPRKKVKKHKGSTKLLVILEMIPRFVKTMLLTLVTSVRRKSAVEMNAQVSHTRDTVSIRGGQSVHVMYGINFMAECDYSSLSGIKFQ